MMLLKCSEMMLLRKMTMRLGIDVGDDVEEDGGYVEVKFDVVNPDHATVVLDEVVVAADVYVFVVANLLDDEVVEVDVVDVPGDVAVLVNLIDVTVDDVVCDDLDVVVVAVVGVSELLIVNDDVDDVDVDHLGDVVCWLLPVHVVDALLVVEVVVNDVKVVAFRVVDDDDCDAAVVSNVVDDVKTLILQDIDYNNNDDACSKSALMHAKEKASKDDAKELVRGVVVNKNVYEDVDVNDEVVVEDDVVKSVEDEQAEVCDVDVNEEIHVLDPDVLQVGDVLKVGDVDGKMPLET